MAKKANAVYAPGELDRVREKLDVNDDEAKRVAGLLGGEVGVERSEEPINTIKGKKPFRREVVELAVGSGGRPGRRIDIAYGGEGDDSDLAKIRTSVPYPGDDPSLPIKLRYFERVKMDRYAGQFAFEIKNSLQVMSSIFSFFRAPADYVNPRFVVKRMNEYYSKIERLVTMSRNLFPVTNTKRNSQLKRASPAVYKMLDIFRNWNIELIARSLAGLQARPREVTVSGFTDILRAVYRPLYILEDLDTETVKGAFKLIYKILYIESPMDAKEKYQDIIRNIIAALMSIRRDVQFGMYPLLMKLLSDRWISYERFFIERRRRYMSFLNVSEQEQLAAEDLNLQQLDKVDVETLRQNQEEQADIADPENQEVVEEDLSDPKVIERKAKVEAENAEHKALEQGLAIMEALFPKAGWDDLEEYPDLYPYFADVYSLRRGYELLSPTDPLHQISVLMYILEDLFYAMRYVKFGTVTGPDGTPVNVTQDLNDVVNNWRGYIENSFMKEYLPRLMEYCRILENSPEARTSVYAKKYVNELHWIKRLSFLPYYKFESLGPPPFQKQDVIPIYSRIRMLRKHLSSVAKGVEHGMHSGGAAAKAPCEGISNPWESYNFEIPNPISRRLNMMLPPEKRNNASLIFFSLSVATILDYVVNNEDSWFYYNRPEVLFRSIRNEGITPLFGVDQKIDADKIFKDSMKAK